MPAIPTVLRANNLTPATRTPWGGHKILEVYKVGLPEVAGLAGRVGESWEVSVEPSFPSITSRGESLRDVIAADPLGWLGAEVAARHDGQLPLLVKLLDAADNLSVQVHPSDAYPALGGDESGKPESWLVLDSEPGAGLFLGLAPRVSRVDVETCLADGGRLDALLNFVPVTRGDFFEIDAGTIHAVGAGVTLVEPQRVQPGRRGVTYRLWDWNRRYGPGWTLDPDGETRPLHLDRALAVICFDGPRGEEFVEACRGPNRLLEDSGLRHVLLTEWSHFRVEHLKGSGTLSLNHRTMTALTCTQGSGHVSSVAGRLAFRAGQSVVIPATVACEVECERTDLVLTSV